MSRNLRVFYNTQCTMFTLLVLYLIMIVTTENKEDELQNNWVVPTTSRSVVQV